MSRHLRVAVKTFDFCRHVGEIHVCRPEGRELEAPLPDTIVSSGKYLLVPEGEIGAAFASLQDAGDAAGCPVGMDIMQFIGGQRSLLAEAMSTLEILSSTDAPGWEMSEARERAERLSENYKAARQ